MTARTLTGPSRREQNTCERIIVRYMLPGGGWQADRVLPAVWDQSELKAQRRLKELRAEGKTAEIIRRTPIM